MADGDPRSDDELVRSARSDPDAFALLYRRHVHALLGYFYRRTEDAELAADLTAETFAEALDRVGAIASADATARSLQVAFDGLPADQRAAIEARVLDEREYAEIASSARTSASVIRQRVSRGLAGL